MSETMKTKRNNQVENNQVENNQVENNQVEDNQAENNQAENNQAENNQMENNQVESNQAKSNRAQNNKGEAGKIGNKEYKLSSARGTFLTLLGGGRIFNTVTMDDEKMSIVTRPTKKSTIPVLYYEDITNVAVNTKITGYAIFWILAAIAACFAQPGCVIFIPIFIWGGLNRKITISLRSGNQAVIYSRSKKRMEAFVSDVKAAAKIS